MIYLILFSRTIDSGCFCRFSGCLHGKHGGPGEGGFRVSRGVKVVSAVSVEDCGLAVGKVVGHQ